MKNYRLFITFLKYIIVILVIPLVILMTVYVRLTTRIHEQVYEMNLSILENSSGNMDGVFKSIEKMLIYFTGNVSIANYIMNVKDPDKAVMYMRKAEDELKAMSISDSDLINVQLYLDGNNSLIDFTTCALYPERYYGGIFSVQGLGYNDWYQEYLDTEEKEIYQHAYVTFQGMTQEALVYNREFNVHNMTKENNRLLFYINKEVLFRWFEPIDYREGGFVSVLDSDGEVILSSAEAPDFMEIQNSIRNEGKKGYTKFYMDDCEMLLTYFRSSTNGWLYAAAVPLNKVLCVIEPLRVSMLVLISMAALSGILLSLLVARKLSRPFAKGLAVLGTQEREIPLEEFEQEIVTLVQTNDMLKNEMEHKMSGIKTAAFYNLIHGNEKNPKVWKEQLELLGIRQDARYYVILIVVYNDTNLDANLEDIGAQKLYLEKVIRQQEKERQIEGIYQLDLERMMILMSCDKESKSCAREEAELLIKEMMNIIRQNIFYSISVGGDIVEDYMELPKGFSHAQRVLRVQKNIFGKNDIQWYERLKQYLQAKIKEEESIEESNTTASSALISEIKMFIERNYNNAELSLSMAAESFYVTEVYLSKLFKNETGQNFSKYVEAVRMEHAREMIKNGNLTVNEVAEKVGYKSSQVFRRAWKRYFGTTPTGTKAEDEPDDLI